MVKNRLRLALLSAATAVTMIGASVSASYAEETDTNQIPSKINPQQNISLTVHKYTAPAGETTTGGKEAKKTDLPKGAKPVNGVEFTWKKVDSTQINLLTNQGWKDAAAIAKKFNETHNLEDLKIGDAKLNFVKTGSGTTSEGKVKFDFAGTEKESPVGLYLITETNVANAMVDGSKVAVSPALPFLVTLPMTDVGENAQDQNARTKWNYDVHVYPKNAVVKITKEVEDSTTVNANSANESDLTYVLKSDIPLRTGAKTTNDEPTALDKYVVLDKTDPAKVTILNDNVKVQYCVPSADPANPTCSDAATTDYTKELTSGLLKVTFNEAGLKALGKKRAEAENAEEGTSKQAFVKLSVPVKLIGDATTGTTTSDLENSAYLVPDNEHGETLPPDPNDPTVPGEQPSGKLPPIPSNKVVTKFAQIKLKKVDDSGANLADATFGLYTCTIDNTKKTLSATAGTEQPVMKDGKQVTAVSNTDGDVLFPQVRVSDFANNKELANSDAAGYRGYCVKEIKAPAGFELTPEFIPVDVKSAQVASGVYTLSDNVVNVKHNAGFKLPLTGSVATVALLLAAGIFMIGGLLVAVRRRKEQV